MKIIIVGASGNIGRFVTEELSKKYEVITASRNSGDIKVDLTSLSSIKDMYKKLGKLDAVICTAGETYFGDFEQTTEEQFFIPNYATSAW